MTTLTRNSKVLNTGIILNSGDFSTSSCSNRPNKPKGASESKNSNDSNRSNSLLNNLKFNMKYISFFKKLAKYILIGAIFKLIIYFFFTILSFFNINAIHFYLLIWILLFYSIIISKNKREYIITMGILVGFWYTIGNMFSINELQCLSFFMFFAANYDGVLSFDLSNDYYSNNFMSSQNKNVLIESLDCLYKDIRLIETKWYDPAGSVEKLKVEKIYNPLYETSETNLDPQLMRLQNIENIRLEAKSLNIKDLSGFVLSKADLLEMVKDNLIKYEAEALKFKNTVNSIEKCTESFYDPKSKILFLQYLNELIPRLLEDNRSYLFNMLSDILSNLSSIPVETQGELESFLSAQNVSLPEQTEEEIESLSPQSVALPEQIEEEIESLSPQSVALPEQTEEEINSLV